jgi:hypothetical protein
MTRAGPSKRKMFVVLEQRTSWTHLVCGNKSLCRYSGYTIDSFALDDLSRTK